LALEIVTEAVFGLKQLAEGCMSEGPDILNILLFCGAGSLLNDRSDDNAPSSFWSLADSVSTDWSNIYAKSCSSLSDLTDAICLLELCSNSDPALADVISVVKILSVLIISNNQENIYNTIFNYILI